jgi:hypothetical protein
MFRQSAAPGRADSREAGKAVGEPSSARQLIAAFVFVFDIEPDGGAVIFEDVLTYLLAPVK